MFIRENIFKKLVKKAFDDEELDIERRGELIAIKAGWWHLQCIESHLSNKAKACLIELIGNLPGDGMAMLYGKDCEPQIAIPGTVMNFEQNSLHNLLTDIYEPTRVMIVGGECSYIMLQNRATKEKVLVNSTFIDIIDIGGIDEDSGETQVNIAPLGSKDSKMLNYHNNVMDFTFYRHPVKYRKTKEIMDLLGEKDCAWNLIAEERLD